MSDQGEAYFDELGREQHLLLTLLTVDNNGMHEEAEELAGACGLWKEFNRFRKAEYATANRNEKTE